MRDVEFVLALVAVSAGLRVVSLRFAIPYVPALVIAALARVSGALNHASIVFLLRTAIVIAVCLVVVRAIYVRPAAYVVRDIGRRFRGEKPMPPAPRAVAFVAWAGLRGIHSLVLALSVPLATSAGPPFPARDQIIFISVAVILLGLIVQAPTLAPLARGFGLTRATEDAKEEAHARLAAAEAALHLLGEPGFAGGFEARVLRTSVSARGVASPSVMP